METAAVVRGFTETEFENRMHKVQAAMHQKNIDAILITNEANIYYFTGFLTQFWKSPTRPWFVVLPAEGKPIAVVPGIGRTGMEETWLDEVHTWDAPNPEDDGVSLLTFVLQQCCTRHKRLGIPLGPESKVFMPFNDFIRLQENLENLEFVDVAHDLRLIRAIKSPAEVEKIEMACRIANKGFDLIPSHARLGQTERDLCREMRTNMLQAGADSVEFLVCGSGPGGYDSIIMGPTNRVLQRGDIAILDTGATFDGYYCDFCRNFGFGEITDEAKRANDAIHRSIDAALQVARPGATTTDLYHAMWRILEAGGALGNDVGRLGHGLGCELTEYPSNTATDNTVLETGMVITLEPGMHYAPGKSLVHEENIVITEDGARLLSRRADPDILILD